MVGHPEVTAAIGQHGAPFRAWRLRAEADEGERGADQDGRADAQAHIDDHRRKRARQHVPQHDHDGPHADAAGGLHVGADLERERAAAHEAREHRHAEHGHGPDHVGHPGADHRHDRDRQQQAREREHDVAKPHDQQIRPAAAIAAQQPQRDPHHAAEQRRDEADGQRDARTPDDPAQDVAPVRVGAGEVLPARAFQGGVVVRRGRVIGGDQRGEQGQQDDQQDDQPSQDRHPAPAEAPPELRRRRADFERRAHCSRTCGFTTA